MLQVIKPIMQTFIVLSLAVIATFALPRTPLNEKWTQLKASMYVCDLSSQLTHQKEYSSQLEEIRR
jgi:cathepsin L